MATERLNKYLAGAGVASRRKADELIAAGLIKINGQVVTELGWQINPQVDRVEYQDRIIKPAKPLLFMFNKPKGVTSTLSDRYASKTIADYFRDMARVYPVGRLDKDSEGLMLVTNDGDLANQLTHPRYEHEKEYEVTISGPSKSSIPKFAESFELDGYSTQPMQVELKEESALHQWLISLVLKEGRKRQIRRVAETLGYKVIRLKRVRIGKLVLGNLPIGEYQAVLPSEVI